MLRRAAVMAVCTLAIVASVFRFTATPGPGLDPDALSYLGAARSFVSDGTFRIPSAPWASDSATAPLTHFPPGFSAVLAVPMALGADGRLAARLVESAAAGATTLLVMLVLWPAAGAWGAALGALVVALSPAFVLVHLSVLSEPLFLALVMLAFWTFVRHPRAALWQGVVAAAAALVRYAGLSVAGAAALWALRDTGAPWRDRLKRAALALAPSLVAMATWSMTRAHAPGTAKPIRRFALYGNWGPTLLDGAHTVGHLLVPSLEWEAVPQLAVAGTLVALAALVWSTTRASGDATPRDSGASATYARALLLAAGLLALCYTGLVVASRALADPGIPFDFRLMAPLVPLGVITVAVVAARAWRVISRPARLLGALALAAWGVLAVRTIDARFADIATTDGSDFASRDWRESPMLRWVRAQGGAHTLYANWTCAVWFHLGRTARELPDTLDVADPSRMRRFTERLRASDGLMLAWNLQNIETAPTDTIVARAGLVRIAAFDDGAVYAAPPLAVPSPGGPSRVPRAVAPPAPRR